MLSPKVAIRVAAVCGLLISTVVSLPQPQASASVSTASCSTQGLYFDGFYHDVGTQYRFEGSSGYIFVRDGAVCDGNPTDGNPSTAWNMIAANPTASSDNGWAQSGFIRTGLRGLTWFSQAYAQSYSGSLFTRFANYSVEDQVGVRHTFRELYRPSCGCVQMYIDSTVWAQTPFDPYGTWAYPFDPQFLAEAHYLTSNIPGSPQAPAAYSALGAQLVTNDALIAMPCSKLAANDNPARWGRSASRCDAFKVWTK